MPKTTRSPMAFVNEQSILEFYDAFSSSDFETMHRMMHPDCTLEFPGSSFPNRVTGRDAIIDLFRGIQAAMGGSLRFHSKWAIFKGDMAAVHWFTTGRPAHGGRYLNRGVAWYRLKDGLVHEFQDFLDTEIITAFWPDGRPCSDFTAAEKAVGRLVHYASADALERFRQLGSN